MASKKNKNSKKRNFFSRKNFVTIICKQCNLCKQISNPTFCYDSVYRTDPHNFIQNFYKFLLDYKTEENKEFKQLHEITKQSFAKKLCPKICSNVKNGLECILLPGCYEDFIDQLLEYDDSLKKPKDKKRICKSLPDVPSTTSFFSQDKNFIKKINRILYGDNHPK